MCEKKITRSSVIHNFHLWRRYTLHRRRYNTKIRFGIVSRGENTKEIGNIASTRFLRKREPRVLSERGIVQRARDNRGRPFRKFDGMRSLSAKRRHPGETFYVWVVIYLLDRNTIAFHLEILVQYPRYNFVGRIFGRERERERIQRTIVIFHSIERCSTRAVSRDRPWWWNAIAIIVK